MSIDLSTYTHITSALLLKWQTPTWYDSSTDTYSDVTHLATTFNIPITYSGDTYLPMGSLLSITDSSSDIRITPGEIQIVLSAVPVKNSADLLKSKIKGTKINVWRVFFDPHSAQPLAIPGNPAGRFKGIVNNYTLQEDATENSTDYGISMVLTCSNTVSVLSNKLSGRRSNPADMKALYPSDTSMDRVMTLANSNFNFGAVIK